MGRKPSAFGIEFRERFNYYGKLTKSAMGKELWNEYNRLKSLYNRRTEDYVKSKEVKREERHQETLKRREERKLNGESYAKYCKDFTNIKNYDKAKADGFKGWQLHHIAQTHFSDGTLRPLNARLTSDELKALGLYWDRPASELIFMERVDHRTLHQAKSRKLLDYINMKYFTNISLRN